MFGLVTGENLGQRRPYREVSLIVLVNNSILFNILGSEFWCLY